jgi:hypothetical protein
MRWNIFGKLRKNKKHVTTVNTKFNFNIFDLKRDLSAYEVKIEFLF